MVAIAKEAGFSISADDLTKAQSELSDEELEVMAGGGGCIFRDTREETEAGGWKLQC